MPAGRVLIAMAADRWDWSPAWTRVDNLHDNLISGFDIHRGKSTEADTTDTSTATVYVNDRYGYFDPDNTGSPFYSYGGRQILLQVYDPVAAQWVQQARMWIDDVDFDINPATMNGESIVSNVQLHCIDIIGVLSVLEMDVSGHWGDPPPSGSEGIIFYEDSSPGDGSGFDDRLIQILDDAGVTSDWYTIFTGNVDLLEAKADPGDSPMLLIQQALDAEFPSLANGHSSKLGKLRCFGRGARFDPDDVSAGATPGAWDFTRWDAGDGAAITGDPTLAQIRPPLAWSYAQSKKRNVGYCYPADANEADKPGQTYVVPGTTAGERRTWRAEGLLTKAGTTTGNTGLEECLAFATFWATVLSLPATRISALTFKSTPTGHPQAAVSWALMLNAEISDIINLTHGYRGGVGMEGIDFFVEGSEMSVRPTGLSTVDMVTVSFNVSPAAYFADPMGLLG